MSSRIVFINSDENGYWKLFSTNSSVKNRVEEIQHAVPFKINVFASIETNSSPTILKNKIKKELTGCGYYLHNDWYLIPPDQMKSVIRRYVYDRKLLSFIFEDDFNKFVGIYEGFDPNFKLKLSNLGRKNVITFMDKLYIELYKFDRKVDIGLTNKFDKQEYISVITGLKDRVRNENTFSELDIDVIEYETLLSKIKNAFHNLMIAVRDTDYNYAFGNKALLEKII
jgi:hypothetical protein